jgi:hypothetical protein
MLEFSNSHNSKKIIFNGFMERCLNCQIYKQKKTSYPYARHKRFEKIKQGMKLTRSLVKNPDFQERTLVIF